MAGLWSCSVASTTKRSLWLDRNLAGLLGGTLDAMKPRPALYKVHLWPSDRVERFLAFIPRGAAGSCWRWQGSHGGKGQGRYRYRESGRQGSVYAARVAWILENGPVPRNREVVHSCLNVDCCNVARLFDSTTTVGSI